MKHLVHNTLGNPAQVLTLEPSDFGPLQPREVRAEVLAAPIHPSDLLQISGEYGVKPNLPRTPGGEGVGTIVEVGEGVTHLSPGQKVILPLNQGTWRTHMQAPAQFFIPLPETQVDVEQLSMLTINPATALLLLTDYVTLQPGDWIIQNASNSAVGAYVVQIAKERGWNTINIVRREGAMQTVRDAGGEVILVDGPDLVQQVREVVGDGRVALGLDAVGGEAVSRFIQTLSPGATLVSYGVLSMQQAVLHSGLLIFQDLRLRGFWLARWFQESSDAQKQELFAQLVPLFGRGVLKAPVGGRYALDDFEDAMTHAARAKRDGKIILFPQGTP